MTPSLLDSLRSARVYDLEQPRFRGMPIHPSHLPGYFYALHRRHRDTYRPAEHGPRSGASGVLTMMEHSGTHLDALCHQASELTHVRRRFRRTPPRRRPASRTWASRRCRRSCGAACCSTWPAGRGRSALPAGISDQRRRSGRLCRRAGRARCRQGDVLLVRTGYGALWQDEAAYLRGGGRGQVGDACGRRSAASSRSGPTTWPGTCPTSATRRPAPRLFAHVYLLPQKGIYIIENLNLEELASDRRWEFAFIGVPLKFQGATGLAAAAAGAGVATHASPVDRKSRT